MRVSALALLLVGCGAGAGDSAPAAGGVASDGGAQDGAAGSADGGGGKTPPATSDAGADADAGAAGGASLQGAIPSFPVAVGAPSIATSALPLLSVYWSNDAGASWYANYERCADVFGSSKTVTTFEVAPGTLTLLESYCTAGANRYDVEVRPATKNFSGAIGAGPLTVSDPVFAAPVLPAVGVYWSDGASAPWYSVYDRCAETFGSSTLAQTFQITAGTLTFPRSYCTQSASRYQIAAAPAAKTLSGTIGAWPVTLADPVFAGKTMPQVSVYWSNDNGTTWYSTYATCAETFGSTTTVHTFSTSGGALVLNRNWCTENATRYQVVVM